jgi:hypothetical protein
MVSNARGSEQEYNPALSRSSNVFIFIFAAFFMPLNFLEGQIIDYTGAIQFTVVTLPSTPQLTVTCPPGPNSIPQ